LEIVFQLFDKGYEVIIDPRVFVYHEGGASHAIDIRPKSELDEIQQKNFELFKSRWPQYTKDWE